MSTDDADVRRWTEIAAITDLIHRYSDAVTRADWAQAEALFAPDAVWESPLLGMHFSGGQSFLDHLALSTQACDLLIQTATSPVVTLLGPDRATVTTTIVEIVRGVATADTPGFPAGVAVNVRQHGIYYDEVARGDGAWRFTHREFVPMYVETDTVNGQIVAPRASLARRGAGAPPGA
jgi:hypothetical protein